MAGPVGVLAGVAASWAVVTAARPSDAGPTFCAFRTVTGLDCPFCGSTRAAASLGTGDLIGALDHNAWFVVAVLPLAVAAWLVWARSSWQARTFPMVPTRAVLVVIALTGAWWAVRLAVPWLGSGAAA